MPTDDSQLYGLTESVFRNTDWTFRYPEDRRDEPHLADLDPGNFPEFEWRAGLAMRPDPLADN